MKRAAVYIRVSTEKQADKVSPKTQETDCLDYCQRIGYQVVGVYRDIERYRIGKKMVEPAGTRADRPGLLKMLGDASGDNFDVIVAWTPDRLFRGYAPMYLIDDCLSKNKIDLDTVKERIDVNWLGIACNIAKKDNDTRRERVLMGVAGRLADGKPWCTVPPYGYRIVDDQFEINETEAEWVRKIFEWRAEGVSLNDIRQGLINAAVPMRRRHWKNWSINTIQHRLAYTPYHTGILPVDWDGKRYEIAIPPLISKELGQACYKLSQAYKKYPYGKLKANSLVSGLVYCKACNRLMHVITNHQSAYHTYYYYSCTMRQFLGEYLPECARHARMETIDADVWSKIAGLLDTPGLAEELINQIKPKYEMSEEEAFKDLQRIERQINDLTYERQKVINWAKKELITEDDLKIQLAASDENEEALNREWSEKRLIAETSANGIAELEEVIRGAFGEYRDTILLEPRTPEEAQLQFEKRRGLVQKLVKRVDVLEDKTVKVHLRIAAPDSCTINIPVYR